jgi:hypothetical protein
MPLLLYYLLTNTSNASSTTPQIESYMGQKARICLSVFVLDRHLYWLLTIQMKLPKVTIEFVSEYLKLAETRFATLFSDNKSRIFVRKVVVVTTRRFCITDGLLWVRCHLRNSIVDRIFLMLLLGKHTTSQDHDTYVSMLSKHSQIELFYYVLSVDKLI